jgi:hypothetical protein
MGYFPFLKSVAKNWQSFFIVNKIQIAASTYIVCYVKNTKKNQYKKFLQYTVVPI